MQSPQHSLAHKHGRRKQQHAVQQKHVGIPRLHLPSRTACTANPTYLRSFDARVDCGLQPQTAARLPPTYRRWVALKPGPSFRSVAQLEEVNMPKVLGPNEVLIRMVWAGINGGCETFRARAEYHFARTDPAQLVTLGAEGAGVVVATGPKVAKLKVGQAVAVNASSAFSEYCVAKERLVTPFPVMDDSDDSRLHEPGPEAAVLALSGMTAIAALEGVAQVKAGEVVVITAAAGGTGHIAVQVALLAGCRVIAVVGSPNKEAALEQLQSDDGRLIIIDRSNKDLATCLPQLCPHGVDVVFDGVGGAVREVLLTCLAPGGRFLQVGYIADYPHAKGYPTSSNEDGSPTISIPHCAVPSIDSGKEPVFSVASGSGGSMPPSRKDTIVSAQEEWEAAVEKLPPAWQLFWNTENVTGLPGGRVVLGQVWPRDARTLLRCKARLYDLYYKQQLLEVWAHDSHGLVGLTAIPDAIDYMLAGKHVGKVVLRLVDGNAHHHPA